MMDEDVLLDAIKLLEQLFGVGAIWTEECIFKTENTLTLCVRTADQKIHYVTTYNSSYNYSAFEYAKMIVRNIFDDYTGD